jgi:hypothetical protein
MKAVLLILAAVSIFPLAQAEESMPPDVQRVVDQRAAAVAKIDKIYLQELEKLKLNYTKKGDLETANKIVALTKQVSLPFSVNTAEELKTFLEDTVWNWSSDESGSNPDKLKFYNDGTYNISVDSAKNPWSAQSATTVAIVGATIRFSSDFKSFIAETKEGIKRYGVRIEPK